jgi:TolA-binding protein
MQWLLDLIAKHTKDGVLDTEALTKEVNTEFPKHAVPKADFNTLNEQLKTANGTIADLKKNNADNETLQGTIKEHEKTIAGLKTEGEKTRKEYALKDKLREQNVTDPDYLIYKHGGVDKFNFDKDGNPIGLEDSIKPYKESMSHIFKTGNTQTNYNPAGGGGGAGKNPFAKDSFNLTEQGKLLKENPVQAKELAAAAGVII